MSELTEALERIPASWPNVPAMEKIIDAARRWAEVEPLLAELRAAIEDEGPFPQHHRQVMIRHRREWPTLWNVLDRLVPVSDGERLER